MIEMARVQLTKPSPGTPLSRRIDLLVRVDEIEKCRNQVPLPLRIERPQQFLLRGANMRLHQVDHALAGFGETDNPRPLVRPARRAADELAGHEPPEHVGSRGRVKRGKRCQRTLIDIGTFLKDTKKRVLNRRNPVRPHMAHDDGRRNLLKPADQISGVPGILPLQSLKHLTHVVSGVLASLSHGMLLQKPTIQIETDSPELDTRQIDTLHLHQPAGWWDEGPINQRRVS